MSTFDLRPLRLGEILDRTFSLYRQHFLLFLAICGIPQLLSLAVGLARLWTGANAVSNRGAGRVAVISSARSESF